MNAAVLPIMRCEHVFHRHLVTIPSHYSAFYAAQVMRERDIGFLPVCDSEGHAVGVLTDRDLAVRVCAVGQAPDGVSVAAVMSTPVVSCRPDDSLVVVEQLMIAHRLQRILVTDDRNVPVGVVAVADLAAHARYEDVARTYLHVVGVDSGPLPASCSERASLPVDPKENTMRIGDVMTTKVETIAPNESAHTAWQHMQVCRVRHLVVTEGTRVVGMLSDRDVGGTLASAELLGCKTVGELMTSDPTTTTRDATLREVANLLRGNVFGCLPVVDENKLVGIISTTDLLDLIGRGAERPVEQSKRWTLKNRGPREQKTRRPQ